MINIDKQRVAAVRKLEALGYAERMGLEGVVSKLWVNAYRSGSRCDWIKVKCPSWRERNRDRWRLFERP